MQTIQKFILVCSVVLMSGFAFGDEPDRKDRFIDAPSKPHLSRKGCSLRDVTGKWLFATSIGRQMLMGFPPDKEITALGTMNIRRDGTLSGTFDVTVEDSFFIPGIGYEGSVVINRDCTGTLTFVTEAGSSRTDSIAVVGRGEIIAMSQDPANLWTYQVRRVGHLNRKRD